MTLGASNYLLHEGDVVTGYLMTLNTALPKTANLTGGTTITSVDAESTFQFESFYIPPFTEIVVKKRAVRAVTVESVSGNFAVGETFVTGSGGNTAQAEVLGQFDINPDVANNAVRLSNINFQSLCFFQFSFRKFFLYSQSQEIEELLFLISIYPNAMKLVQIV